MRALNFAILKYFTTVEEACADDVINALKEDYGSYKGLRKKAVSEALMTAETNGILEEIRSELGDENELKIYYRANEEGAAIINRYIKD